MLKSSVKMVCQACPSKLAEDGSVAEIQGATGRLTDVKDFVRRGPQGLGQFLGTKV